MKIEIAEYNPGWVKVFEEEKKNVCIAKFIKVNILKEEKI